MPDVRDSFKNVAANYSKSTFHTSSARLQEVLDLMRPKPGDLALDVATGTGNTAFALAPYVRRVVGLDLTREMLNEARRIAAEKEFKNTDWVIGDAEHLPFQDDTFDIYVVRAAPHHFPDIDRFIAEAFRVLKPDRDASFIDCAPPLPARDVLHEVEMRRDPSHVLSLTVEEVIVLVDKVGRRHRVRLRAGERHSIHSGLIQHDDLIGRPEGIVVTTQLGARLLAVRPTFAEQVTGRRRQTQPIYPKDLGA